MKKAGEDTAEIMKKMKELSDRIAEENTKLTNLSKKQLDLLLSIPNIPHESVPVGKDDSENVEVRKNGRPREFTFSPRAHWDIGKSLDILDPERAAKVTGKRFHFYRQRLSTPYPPVFFFFHLQDLQYRK